MTNLLHKFVKNIPDEIESDVLYISTDYSTAIHKCPCGCDNDIVTPLSPTDWKLIFDGKTVSLYPSIGNWNLKCQSHYWINNNKIEWAPKWTKRQIEQGRAGDEINKKEYYEGKTQKSFFGFLYKKR